MESGKNHNRSGKNYNRSRKNHNRSGNGISDQDFFLVILKLIYIQSSLDIIKYVGALENTSL